MTDPIEEARALLASATPGPWRVYDNAVCDDGGSAVARGPLTIGTQTAARGGLADADFIAHAPTDIAALLAEVRTLRDQLATVEHVRTEERAAWMAEAESLRSQLAESRDDFHAVSEAVGAMHNPSTGPSYPGTRAEVVAVATDLWQRAYTQSANYCDALDRLERAEAALAEVDMILGVTGADQAFRARLLRSIRARMETVEAALADVMPSEEEMDAFDALISPLMKPTDEFGAIKALRPWFFRVDAARKVGG